MRSGSGTTTLSVTLSGMRANVAGHCTRCGMLRSACAKSSACALGAGGAPCGWTGSVRLSSASSGTQIFSHTSQVACAVRCTDWVVERHRRRDGDGQQQVVGIAEVHQRADGDRVGDRPADVGSGKALRQRPCDARGLAGVPGVLPVRVPVRRDALAQTDAEGHARLHGIHVRDQRRLNFRRLRLRNCRHRCGHIRDGAKRGNGPVPMHRSPISVLRASSTDAGLLQRGCPPYGVHTNFSQFISAQRPSVACAGGCSRHKGVGAATFRFRPRRSWLNTGPVDAEPLLDLRLPQIQFALDLTT